MTYTLVRSKRRTMGIYILADGRIEVRVPWRCPASTVQAFIDSRQEWTEKKQQEVQLKLSRAPAYPLCDGGTLPYRGRELPLKKTQQSSLAFDGGMFWIPSDLLSSGGDRTACQKALIALYKQLTAPLLMERVQQYAALLNVSPQTVKVSSACKRWGSCSGKGNLNFSWMLAAAPPAALDYVVVHELCHLREHNHSERFWKLVASVLPDYVQRQTLLRETEHRLAEW